jgi:hypothetical protein
LLPERTTGAHCIGGWVGLRAGQDTEARGKIFASAEDRTPIARSSATSKTIIIATVLYGCLRTVFRRISETWRDKVREAKENCIMKRSIICTLYQIQKQ